MTLAGEHIERSLQLLRVIMDRDGLTLEEGLAAAGPLIPQADHDPVRQLHMRQASTTIVRLAPNVISEGGPRPWFDGCDTSQGYYWRRQRGFLAHVLARKDYELDSLDIASDRVLAHLENPAHPERFDVRGLVIGHVQSGKTANFSAVIAKAADAGYKIVIVLSGLHNSLRRQTQQRLERDLGRENADGVGLPTAGRRWVWVTGSGLNEDFDESGFSAAILQGNDQVIFVVKKNKSRLERMIGWIGDHVPENVPVLVIDDEGDQASVNTQGDRPLREEYDLTAEDFVDGEPDPDELSPSAINFNIRRMLNLFGRSCYVAYTATPFANVLINPRATDRLAGADLFPQHFIISLPPPPGDAYIGPSELFGRDGLRGEEEGGGEPTLDVVKFVKAHEAELLIPPAGKKRKGFVPSIPPSMKEAIYDFLLAAAARLQRSSTDAPCTMLVHTHQQRAMQNPLEQDIRSELAYIRQRWRYEAQEFRPLLQKRWRERFESVTAAYDLTRVVAFDAIVPFIDSLLRDGIDVRVLNSDTDHELDFDREPHLKAILIGGNKLSRGVTVEGLLVSYYVRKSPYYDTLMQMGRWFGYRGSYVDLTRLYSTETLVSWFHDLATAEEELRRQVGRYEREGLTPAQFVPKVRKHPVMLITSKLKMRDAEESSVSFAGERIQTLRWPLTSTPDQHSNVAHTREFLRTLGPPAGGHRKPAWSAVGGDSIVDYLCGFSEHDQRKWDRQTVLEYIRAQRAYGELLHWWVLLSCGPQVGGSPLGTADLGVWGLPSIPLISRTRLAKDPTSLGVVTDPEDERIGLSPAQLEEAVRSSAAKESDSLAEALRAQRRPTEGLLVIYPISPSSQPRRNSRDRIPLYSDGDQHPPLIAYSISFPFSKSPATVKYVQARFEPGMGA